MKTLDKGFVLKRDSFVSVVIEEAFGWLSVYETTSHPDVPIRNWRPTVGRRWRNGAEVISFLVEKGYTFVSSSPKEECLWIVSLEHGQDELYVVTPRGPRWAFYELEDALAFKEAMVRSWRDEKVDPGLSGLEQPYACLWSEVDGKHQLVHSYQPDVEYAP